MPDENRKERMPFSTRNEPPLQWAVLLFLLDQHPTRVKHQDLMKAGFPFGWGVLEAIKSLVIACLVDVDDEERMRPSPMAVHFHWLMTEVEAPDA